MGEQTVGTAYGDELLPAPNGPAGNTPSGPGRIAQNIRSRLAPGPVPDAEEATERPRPARISTGEQELKSSRQSRQSDTDAPSRVTQAEADSAAKSTVAPLKMAGRLVGMALGVEAAPTQDELRDITDPLGRIYRRNPAVAAYVNRYTDPFMLVAAIGVYVARILLTYQQAQLVRAQTRLAQAQSSPNYRGARVDIQGNVTPIPQRTHGADRGVPVASNAAPPVVQPAPQSQQKGPSMEELQSLTSMG